MMVVERPPKLHGIIIYKESHRHADWLETDRIASEMRSDGDHYNLCPN